MIVGKLEAMARRLAHRGPDGEGVWIEPGRARVGLAHRRLAILDRSPASAQPFASENGQLVLTYNGEVYNFEELKAELRQRGHAFRSAGDTEVLLRAYEEWDVECLEYLNGMFAFALWDGRRQRLFCARDRFGEKPFVYREEPGRFAFASEAKALFVLEGASPEEDPGAIARFLEHGRIDVGGETTLRGVRQLLPAHALLLEPGGAARTFPYYRLTPKGAAPARAREERARELGSLLEDSVRLRLRADVPVGSSLSGGLDSSCIVGIVHRIAARSPAPPPRLAFSARFDDPRLDEGSWIRRVVARNAVAHHEVWPRGEGLAHEALRLHWHLDEPVTAAVVYAHWCVMRLAREAGVTVLLDGQGADEAFAGYPLYVTHDVLGLLGAGRPARAALELAAFVARHRRLPPLLPRLTGLALRGSRAKGLSLVPPELAPHLERAPAVSSGHGFQTPLAWICAGGITGRLLELLRCTDRSSMAFAREVRLPFLDTRVVDYACALPDEARLRLGTSKAVLRDAARGVVPEAIRTRRDKLGFEPPQARWLRGPLRPLVVEALQRARRGELPCLDAKRFEAVWRAFEGGHEGEHPVVWRALSYALFRRAVIEGRGAP